MVRATKTVSAADARDRPLEVFGQVLQALRKEKSVAEVLIALEGQKPHISTNQGTVSGYEQGYTRKPDAVILWGLARAYRRPLEAVVAVLNANRNNPRLTFDEAMRVLERHTHGPSPELAAQAIAKAAQRVTAVAAELESLREGIKLPDDDDSETKPRR
jgi:transcriptional regulator with XRE-family HTH domain